MVNEEEYRQIFDDAVDAANRPAYISDTTKEADGLERLSGEFRVACAALRDSLLHRGLPGYPVVVQNTEKPAPERAYFIGCWTDDDEYDTNDSVWEPFAVYTFVLLTSGMITQASWD